MPTSEFYQRLEQAVKKYGGLVNAHLHLDRSGTLDSRYLSHVGMDPLQASSYSLRVKQNLTGDLHRGPAYEKDDLQQRINQRLDELIAVGTTQAYSFIDVSADRVGLTAFNVALQLKAEKKAKVDFQVGAYPIFGFKDTEPKRWELFVEAAQKADFLGTLPERDDQTHHPRHIGYDEHVKRTLHLAHELGKPIHYHLDQANDPREKGTETIIEAVRWLGSPNVPGAVGPTVWGVHVISPSAYDEKRFEQMLDNLLRYNIGVISCPSAAISMRQLRPLSAPTHNSLARVIEMLERGISVRLGSDNIADVFLPSTTANLYDEAFMFSNATRFYNVDILAKLMCAAPLNDMDREVIRSHLQQDQDVFKTI